MIHPEKMLDPRFHAQKNPDKPAYIMANSGQIISYAQLAARINRMAHLFQKLALKRGDCVALYLKNHPRYFEICWAALHYGLYIVLLDSHLKADEVDYIMQDSDAVVLITSAAQRNVVDEVASKLDLLQGRFMLDGSTAGFEALEDVLSSMPAQPIAHEAGGMYMLYTSGTTGRPKGVRRALPTSPSDTLPVRYGLYFERLFGYNEASIQLIPSHLYHSANINASIATVALGGTVVVMDRFSPQKALELIEQYRVTHSQWVPWHFSTLLRLEEHQTYDLSSLQAALHTTAPCSIEIKEKMIDWWGPILYDDYGMTEGFGGCSITAEEWLKHRGSVGQAYIGTIHIVDDHGQELPSGESGIVYFESDRNFKYYKDPSRTQAARNEHGWATVGDVGYVDEEGYLYIIDRQDDMINVGGINVYPQEIENVLAFHPDVVDAGVIGVPSEWLGEEVKAFVQLWPGVEASAKLATALIKFCKERLSAEKCPSSIDFVDSLPRSPIGKLQRRKLRTIMSAAKPSALGNMGPTTIQKTGLLQKLQETPAKEQYALLIQHLRFTVSETLGLNASEQIELRRGFIDLGLNSLTSIEVSNQLASDLGCKLPVSLLFNYPTIETLAQYLVQNVLTLDSIGPSIDPQKTPYAANLKVWAQSADKRSETEPIAIIGMGCRYPGSQSPEDFWQLMMEKGDAITEVPPDRWDINAYYDPNPDAPGKTHTRYGGFLEQVDTFDAHFFGISPREAVTLDPQQRFVLEVGWEALENAAIAPTELYNSLTGVFIGVTWCDYYELCVYGSPAALSRNEYMTHLGFGGSTSVVPGRLSYFLGLTGPSLVIGTACSSSLVSIHIACQSLRRGECNLALAGGSQLNLTPDVHIMFTKNRMLAPDGRCKSFDASADGYGRSEGCGLVVLKRLSDAIADGDNIIAIVRGSAVNNDGPSSGLVAPNGLAQEALIRQALQESGVSPAQVGYVETHGTGTPVGDPIEAGALGAVYNKNRKQPLLIGSVKTNIGHTESAAGVAGFMKTALALQQGIIPPNLHYKESNPNIAWEELGLNVVTERITWPEGRRLAGVSAFGISGTNAHVVLEEAPQLTPPMSSPVERPLHLLTLNAKTIEALTALVTSYKLYLKNNVTATLADVCYTTNTGRAHFDQRLAIVAEDRAEMIKKLDGYAAAGSQMERTKQSRSSKPSKIAFLFTGQGSQYVNMGRELYEMQPTFRTALERCHTILQPYLEKPLLEVLYPQDSSQASAVKGCLEQTALTQPALFAVEYALAVLWKSWGIEPDIVMGHSLGEYAAACIAGVFSLEDGLRLIAERGRLMQACPQNGAMVVVMAEEAQVAAVIKPYSQVVSIAAVNGPQNVVISGERQAIQAIMAQLKTAHIKTKTLSVSHAFHSPLMDPMLAEFEQVAQGISYNRPHIDLVSNLTGQRVTDEVTRPAYWLRHAREAVRFTAGMTTLQQLGCDVFIEIGPKPTLLGMGSQCVPTGDELWLPSLRSGSTAWQQMLESLGKLYLRGVTVDWVGFDHDYERHKMALPTYPFQRQRHWVPNLSAKQRRTGGTLRPLIDKMIQSPLIKETIVETTFSAETLPYLADYQIFNSVMVSAACHLALILSAAELMEMTTCTLENVCFPATLGLQQDEEVTLQLVFTPQENGRNGSANKSTTFRLISLARAEIQDQLTLHAIGQVEGQVGGPFPHIDLLTLHSSCTTVVDPHDLYASGRGTGIELGASYQWLDAIWCSESSPASEHGGQALGRIVRPEAVGSLAGYWLHPGLLQACFQLCRATLADSSAELWLPSAVRTLQLAAISSSQIWWGHAEQIGDHRWNIRLFDETGQELAKIEGFEMRLAAQQPKPDREDDVPQRLNEGLLNGNQTLLLAYLQDQVIQVAGLDPAQTLSPQQPWLELGLDSLMSVELRNRFRRDLQVVVPIQAIIQGGNTQTITELIQKQVSLSSANGETRPNLRI